MTAPKKAFGKGRSPTRFSFTYEDFAQAFGCSIEAARKHAQRGNYNPKDLMSILEFVQAKLSKDNGDSLHDLVEKARDVVHGNEE